MANLQYATNLPLIRRRQQPLPCHRVSARPAISTRSSCSSSLRSPPWPRLAGPQLPFAEPLGPEGHQGAVVGAGHRIRPPRPRGGEVETKSSLLRSRRRRHHDPRPAAPAGRENRGERADRFLATELKQELGPSRQGLQRLAAKSRPIGRGPAQGRQGNARKIEPDPLPSRRASNSPLRVAKRMGRSLPPPRLPQQHMGRRQGAMAAQSPPPLAGEPAQPVMPSPSWVRKALSERLNSAAMACSSASDRASQHHHGGLPPKGMAEGVDMIETGHVCSLGHEDPRDRGRQGHFISRAPWGLRWILAL